MARFETNLQQNVNLQLGTFEFGPLGIDDDVEHVYLTFTRNQWTNPDARLDVRLVVTGNDPQGNPFTKRSGFVAFGGPAFPAPKPNIVEERIDIGPGTNKEVSGIYTVSGARIRTTITASGELTRRTLLQ